jgi:hypothetical protein
MRTAPGAIATLVAWLAGAGAARADGVCVQIDPRRDTMGAPERFAVRVAIERALEREDVVVLRGGPAAPAGPTATIGACTGLVTGYAIQLADAVSVTLVAGGREVRGRAANLDEVDLLISQLVRSLVTGRSLATGSGVTDRQNVLRAQAAPRRADPRAQRRWLATIAVGGGMLQLPAIEDRARQRQFDLVAIESRWWGFADGDRAAFELTGRLVLHDYAAIGAADDAYDRSRADGDADGDELGRLSALVFSPLAVANYEAGLGWVGFLGDRPPRPWLRLGVSAALLLRFSDPDHHADLGLGAYAGLGLQLTRRVSLSVSASTSNPVVHDFLDGGYPYFLTTTAQLEIHGETRQGAPPALVGPDEPPVIRRVND